VIAGYPYILWYKVMVKGYSVSHSPLTPLKLVPGTSVTDAQRALASFLLDGKARRLSPKTITFYRDQLQPFVAFLAEQDCTTITSMTATHIRGYLVSLQERKLSDNSINGAARAIRAWCNWLIIEGLLTVSPMAKVKMPQRSKEILPAFSDTDVKAILKACETSLRDRAIVLLLLDTGARASECCALNIGDIAADGMVTIHLGKGAKDRVTFLGSQAHRAMRRWLLTRQQAEPDDPLWVSLKTGERLTTDGLRALLERLAARAGIEDVHPHKFRRTFALWSLRNGMDVYALQRLMGHADLGVLRRYLDQTRTDLAEAHREHGPVDAMLKGGKR